MTLVERIDKLSRALGTNKARLQKELGLSNSYFANTARISGRVLQKIKETYPMVNIEWIDEEIGEMFVDNRVTNNTFTVPLIPVSLYGGYLPLVDTQYIDSNVEKIVSPISGASMALTVTGDSMSPEYPNGCIVLLQKINEQAFVEWGRTYVLDTCNGAVIKKVFPCKENNDKILCRSVNSNYDDFEVDKQDIRAFYRVLLQMSLK